MKAPFDRGRPRVWRDNDGISALPDRWGAYRFRGNEGIAYIGIASNLNRRIREHRASRRVYDPEEHIVEYQLASDGVSWDELCRWEREKIARHNPYLVKHPGGNGRRPEIDINGKLVEVAEGESVEDVTVRVGLIGHLRALLGSG